MPNQPVVEAEPVDTTGLDRFAKDRGLPVEFLGAHGIHICPEDGEQPGWITIPFPNLTGIWHNRYRNPGKGMPKYLQAAGTDVHLYNPQRLGPNTDLVIFTEGEIDALVLTYLGYPAIGIPGTQSSTQRFKKAWRLLFSDSNVIVAFDNDDAGKEAAYPLADLFEPHSRVLLPPEEGMDLNDWFLKDQDGMVRAFDATIGGM